MEAYQRQFIEFCLQQKALLFGNFRLKSTRLSPYFFNSGCFNTGSAIAKLGEFYADAIVNSKIKFDMLFGPAYKGIPLVTTVAIALAQKYGIDIPYAFNRKEEKDHGEGKLIVGAALNGRVLAIDDVITAGTTIKESVQIIQSAGAQWSGEVIAFDRQEKGLQSKLSAVQEVEENYGTGITSIVSLQQVMEFLRETGDSTNLEAIRHYQQEYGVDRKPQVSGVR